MVNPGNQMHLVTTSARQASAKTADSALQMHTLRTRLDASVGTVVGSAWSMIQADAFSVAHAKWSDAMVALHTALNRHEVNTNQHATNYEHNDTQSAAGFTRIEAPTLGPIMRA